MRLSRAKTRYRRSERLKQSARSDLVPRSASGSTSGALRPDRTSGGTRLLLLISLFILLALAGMFWLSRLQPNPNSLKFAPLGVSGTNSSIGQALPTHPEVGSSATTTNAEAPEISRLTFTSAGSEEEAAKLIKRMFEVNKPWLNPAAAALSYKLEITRSQTSVIPSKWRKPEHVQLGPFSVEPKPLPPPPTPISNDMDAATVAEHLSAAQQRLLRIGAELVTPIDYMANAPESYRLKMLGRTTWRSRPVIGVDVALDHWVQCRIGMDPDGRGGNVVYGWGYGTREVRILIDEEKSVPLLVIAYTAQGGKYDPRKGTTFEFDPDFLVVDGGLAPRSVAWHSYDNYRGRLRMELEFQVVNGVWIFKDGEERCGGFISSNPDLSPLARMDEALSVRRFQLTDVRVQGYRKN